jgi:hypothetical protein
MLPDKSAFISYYHPMTGRQVCTGNNSFTPIASHGTAIISLNGKKILTSSDCLHVPDLCNLSTAYGSLTTVRLWLYWHVWSWGTSSSPCISWKSIWQRIVISTTSQLGGIVSFLTLTLSNPSMSLTGLPMLTGHLPQLDRMMAEG